MLDPKRFHRDVLLGLSGENLDQRLRELERVCSSCLEESASLNDFQERLYALIENELSQRLGYDLGRWEYDSEIEYWGGQSFMDPLLKDELILKSTFPHGVEFRWGRSTFSSDED